MLWNRTLETNGFSVRLYVVLSACSLHPRYILFSNTPNMHAGKVIASLRRIFPLFSVKFEDKLLMWLSDQIGYGLELSLGSKVRIPIGP